VIGPAPVAQRLALFGLGVAAFLGEGAEQRRATDSKAAAMMAINHHRSEAAFAPFWPSPSTS
jgi:hypothetical protein